MLQPEDVAAAAEDVPHRVGLVAEALDRGVDHRLQRVGLADIRRHEHRAAIGKAFGDRMAVIGAAFLAPALLEHLVGGGAPEAHPEAHPEGEHGHGPRARASSSASSATPGKAAR